MSFRQSADKLGLTQANLFKAAPLLAFHPLNLYRTYVRRRDLKDEIYLRFSASAQPDDFVIRLTE